MAQPDRVALTGADGFLRAFDAEVRRTAGASHNSQLVLRLGPGFEAAALVRAIDRAVEQAPILRAPIGRRLGLFGVPVYRFDRAARAALPRVVVHPVAAPPAPGAERGIPEVFYARLNDRFRARRGELLAFDVVPYEDGRTDLALTWLHLLFDGAGSESFVRWLSSCGRDPGPPDPLPGGDGLGDCSPPELGAGRGREAQRWQRHMGSFAGRPPCSLAGPLARTPQALRYQVTTFDVEETARIEGRARELAGFLTPMLFYLAASIRAHHAVFRARGAEPGSFVVPLPVNLRPKGAEGAIFRTHVSMVWFQASPEQADDLPALLEVLKEQRREAIRGKLIEAGVAAMDYARFAPSRLYTQMARRAFGGELCSFFFAYTDRFLPDLPDFLGAPIENGFHAPSVPPSPGSSLILSVREGRLNVTHVLQEGVLRAGEREALDAALRADLLGR